MQRYFINDDTGQFDKENSHHIKDVIKLKNKDKVVVCFNNECYTCEIYYKNNNAYYKKIDKLIDGFNLDITVLQGLLKKDNNEFVVKYATMFGACKIDFITFNRTIVKNFDFLKKKERIIKISKEAAEVANLFKYPDISYYKSLKEYDFENFDKIFICYENEKNLMLKDLIKEIDKKDKILVVVGPEGGFSDSEISFFSKLKNAKIISLGKNILKAECACLSALSYLKQSLE